MAQRHLCMYGRTYSISSADMNQLTALLFKNLHMLPQAYHRAMISGSPSLPTASVLSLNGLPPEIILILFYELLDSKEGLLSLVTASKYFHSCFQDSQFALFRRKVNHLLDSGPEFCDMVIRLGSLRSRKPWSMEPDEIIKSLYKYGLTIVPGVNISWDERSGLRKQRIIAIADPSKQVSPSMYSGIMAWISAELPFAITRKGLYRPRTSPLSGLQQAMALSQARSEIPGVPRMSIPMAHHPYDTLYIYEQGSDAKRVDVYLAEFEIALYWYRKHFDVPWTETEDRLLGMDNYIPCCWMGYECPRIPRIAR